MSEQLSKKREKIFEFIDQNTNKDDFQVHELTIDSISKTLNYTHQEVSEILHKQILDGDVSSINMNFTFYVPSDKTKKILKKFKRDYSVTNFYSLIIGFLFMAIIIIFVPNFYQIITQISVNVIGFTLASLLIIVVSYIFGYIIYKTIDFISLKYEHIKFYIDIFIPVIGLFIVSSIISYIYTIISKKEFDTTLFATILVVSIPGGFALADVIERKRGGSGLLKREKNNLKSNTSEKIQENKTDMENVTNKNQIKIEENNTAKKDQGGE